MSLLKAREPLPVHLLQPMVQPFENQKQDCADSHGSDPFTQSQPKGSIIGSPGAEGEDAVCLPPAHIGNSRSIALRGGGKISEPWLEARGISAMAPMASNSNAAVCIAGDGRGVSASTLNSRASHVSALNRRGKA